MSATDSKKGGGGCPVQLRLNTIENSRKSLARIIRARMDGRLPEGDFRSATYGLSVLLGFFKEEQDSDTRKMLFEVREMVSDAIKGRNAR